MARTSRIVVPGYPHHINQRGVRSMDVFNSDEGRPADFLFLSEEANRFGLDISAWCLMTNHFHFIAGPHNESSLVRVFGEAHRRYRSRSCMTEFPDPCGRMIVPGSIPGTGCRSSSSHNRFQAEVS